MAVENEVKEAIDLTKLNSLERAVYEAAGEMGLRLFRVADGKVSLEEAAKKLGTTTDELNRIMQKLESKFVHLEFERTEAREEVIERKEGVTPIDVPRRITAGQFTMISVTSDLTLQFGPSGKSILDAIDGEKDVVQLSAESGVPLDYADSILWFLAERKLLSFRRLREDEMKARYGSAGLQIYDKFGREGIFLYTLLDKYGDIQTALKALNTDPEKTVDMYEFIHKLLGMPFALNRKDLLAQLQR